MIKNIFVFISLLLLVTGCKTGSIISSQTKTTQHVTLGSIGLDNETLLQNQYNNTAIPNYKNPIKVIPILLSFNKNTYKAFEKAKATQPKGVTVNYIDSIANKPKYLQLKLADKIEVINALNNNENNGVKTYLSHNRYASLITSASIAFTKKDTDSIINADAVFLVESKPKVYALQLYKAGIKTQLIHFNSGVVFEYKTLKCCWQENKKHQLNIVDLVSEYNNCPNKTYRSAKRAEKNINYYKL